MKMLRGVEVTLNACGYQWVGGFIVPRGDMDIGVKRIKPVPGGRRTAVVYPGTFTLLIEICRSCWK
jgi:hypothetical protein